MAAVRVRQHVNPLSQKFQNPVGCPDWEKVYASPLPLHLDIGCARGRFILKMAQVQPDWNFLGLEIREPLVAEANRIRDELGLTNLHYLFGNANNSLQSLLSGFTSHLAAREVEPLGSCSQVEPGNENKENTSPLSLGARCEFTSQLQYVTIQFPDPWFKKRHQKRRIVQPELVNDLAQYLSPGGCVLIQSDIEEVAVEMRDRFSSHPIFQQQHQEVWLAENPLPVPTEREISTLAKGEPVYRVLFKKMSGSGLTRDEARNPVSS